MTHALTLAAERRATGAAPMNITPLRRLCDTLRDHLDARIYPTEAIAPEVEPPRDRDQRLRLALDQYRSDELPEALADALAPRLSAALILTRAADLARLT